MAEINTNYKRLIFPCKIDDIPNIKELLKFHEDDDSILENFINKTYKIISLFISQRNQKKLIGFCIYNEDEILHIYGNNYKDYDALLLAIGDKAKRIYIEETRIDAIKALLDNGFKIKKTINTVISQFIMEKD